MPFTYLQLFIPLETIVLNQICLLKNHPRSLKKI